MRAAKRASLLLWLVAAGGCSAFVFHPAEDAPAPDASVPEEEPAPAPVAPPSPSPPAVPAASDATSAAGKPSERPSGTAPVRRPSRPRIVILSDSVPAHAALAAELRNAIAAAGFDVQSAEIGPHEPAARLSDATAERAAFAVAVGRRAALAARDGLGVPLVFCQVFDHSELAGKDVPMWGIASLPPFHLQLRAWKRIDPSLHRIGTIVGADQPRLAAAARHAAAAEGLALRVETSSSDRETVYRFRRLVSEVDGFWLFPDNRILSPAAIDEILSQAAAHDVQVVAVNAPLPPGGALMTASATTEDVVRTVRTVLERVVSGDTESLPPITPLSEARVEVDEHAAARHELAPTKASPWVARD